MKHAETPIRAVMLLAVAALLAGVGGCEKPPGPYVPKPLVAPAVVYCNDHTGHKPGSKPWVMGGACCCTPTEALMEKLHADGIAKGMSAEQLRQMYADKGIVLRGPGHEHCNGLCPAGPHVVLGGKCMCPPTPGTDYYESVITGRRPVKAVAAK